MLIQQEHLRHWIDHFYGYGSWKARFWFVGFEEGGGDQPEEVAEKINYFKKAHPSSTPALCDIRELYRHVAFRIEGPRLKKYANMNDHRFGSQSVQHGLWKNLIAFEHGYDGKKLPDLLAYQKKKLALPSSPEALIPLYPLPAHHHAWYYGWLDMPDLPFLKSRTLYEEYIYPIRMKCIISNLKTCKPSVVMMYGMDNINAIKESIQQEFPKAKFKMAKAVKLVTPQYHRADLDGTALILTTQIPTLRHNRIETGFDWEELGRQVRTES